MAAKPINSKQARPEQISQEAPPPSSSTSQQTPISHPGPSGSVPHSHVHPQPFIHSRPSGSVVMYNYEGWTPPPNDAVARARARRRFFVALAWGFLIWIVLGGLIGGGAADMSQTRKHRDRGRMHTWTKDTVPSDLAVDAVQTQTRASADGEAGLGWFGIR
ncbi:hypothetical protein FFLO_01269 [Filobasidium floriforme]|uniref:Uncharacterized protein n=1 Tax=Filobasidium floriforme TaxID=5210 RepID=A0A8K0NSK4_9TREE|nr:hypothetical protein FFLO_01269 [Filobasidium floriforme]